MESSPSFDRRREQAARSVQRQPFIRQPRRLERIGRDRPNGGAGWAGKPPVSVIGPHSQSSLGPGPMGATPRRGNRGGPAKRRSFGIVPGIAPPRAGPLSDEA
ncbi:hypothetical protein FRZ44_42610 [Hypericibacter terrae]|uniref:Uncharacterized protein n=1 Tax=Hypericibacter terrae TaxID=2602015 RepID=A0A5J6MNJ2_9PROT|nr:hypothetical protein FRZ44_42610 [Hypericibacter terrae]